MPVARFLVDTSAWARYPCREVAARLDELGAAGVLETCGLVELHLLGTTRDTGSYLTTAGLRRQAFAVLDMSEADVRRALEVQALLAQSEEFGVPWVALLIAAVAERHGVAVLHANRWFDVIAQITGQPIEWAASSPEMESSQP
jgi:predicted nucleic acid-binding protein